MIKSLSEYMHCMSSSSKLWKCAPFPTYQVGNSAAAYPNWSARLCSSKLLRNIAFFTFSNFFRTLDQFFRYFFQLFSPIPKKSKKSKKSKIFNFFHIPTWWLCSSILKRICTLVLIETSQKHCFLHIFQLFSDFGSVFSIFLTTFFSYSENFELFRDNFSTFSTFSTYQLGDSAVAY